MNTLTQYLEHGGNYDATAAELSVHHSTLKYRLQRIRELTGLELNDPDVHFNLQFATRAWRTLQALRRRALTAPLTLIRSVTSGRYFVLRVTCPAP